MPTKMPFLALDPCLVQAEIAVVVLLPFLHGHGRKGKAPTLKTFPAVFSAPRRAAAAMLKRRCGTLLASGGSEKDTPGA